MNRRGWLLAGLLVTAAFAVLKSAGAHLVEPAPDGRLVEVMAPAVDASPAEK